MSAQDFLANYFLPNYNLYILSVLICFIYSFLLFRNKIRSIIDPLLMAIVGWTFANSVAVFLFFTKSVGYELMVYFITSTFIITGLFYYIYPDKNKKLAKGIIKYDYSFNQYLFSIFVSLYILATLYKFSINGIPLFNESRFAINIDNASGIMGMLGRLSDACSLFCVMCCFFWIDKGQKAKGIIVLMALVTIGLLSGAKGFVLRFCFTYFYYTCLFKNKVPKIKKRYLLAVLLTPLMVISLAGMASAGLDSFIYYGYRILAYGDIYWNAYPNSVINDISFNSPIANMTYMFWGPFRHIFGFDVSSSLMTTGGSLIFERTSGFFPDSGAPNSPIIVMSWVYYRWGGVFLIFILFLMMALFFKNYKPKRRTLMSATIQGSILSSFFSLFGDVYLVFNVLFNSVLLIVLYQTFHFLYYRYLLSKSFMRMEKWECLSVCIKKILIIRLLQQNYQYINGTLCNGKKSQL